MNREQIKEMCEEYARIVSYRGTWTEEISRQHKERKIKIINILSSLSNQGVQDTVQDEEERCAVCNNPFEGHHWMHLHRDKAYHTGCMPKEVKEPTQEKCGYDNGYAICCALKPCKAHEKFQSHPQVEKVHKDCGTASMGTAKKEELDVSGLLHEFGNLFHLQFVSVDISDEGVKRRQAKMKGIIDTVQRAITNK